MAQTCIVCLSELESSDSDATIKTELDDLDGIPTTSGHTALTSKGKEPIQSHTPEDEDQLLAHLLPCGHNLHNECLKPWVERANSCPICRASFNKVELCAKIGGTVIASYDVADKTQEPILDPGLLIDSLDPDESHQDPCTVCEEYNNGRESTLLCCDGCNNTCHPFCAGLSRIPRGPWYCQDCSEDPAILFTTRNRTSGPNVRNVRQHRRRASNPEQEWARVWQSIRSSTGIDLDFPFETPDEQQLNAARRARDDLEQRARIAAEQGAGDRFRHAAETLLDARAQRNKTSPKPEPESQDEIRAWNAFEKAKMVRSGGPSTPSRRKRKSRSATPEEEAAAPEPERTLKRPRTRKTQNTGEASTSTPNAANGTPATTGAVSAFQSAPEPVPAPVIVPVEETPIVQPGPSQPRAERATNGTQTSFLQSLLKEVEVNASADDGQLNQVELAPFIDRASSPQSPQLSSPGASPPLSAQATPRAGTPPPLALGRESPPLASNVIPIYPAAPEFPPFSPADPDGANGHERKNRHHRPSHRSPETSPHRSNDASPTRSKVSLSTKYEVQRMVKAALKPHYRKKQVTEDEYTDINRDISRLLYDKVSGGGGLTDAATRERWQRLAEDEVEIAVKALRDANPIEISPTEAPAVVAGS